MHDKESIVHRDIKPSNILIFPGNVYKICDFGCSKKYKLTDLIKTKTMLGTANFLSPQARKVYEVYSGNSLEPII